MNRRVSVRCVGTACVGLACVALIAFSAVCWTSSVACAQPATAPSAAVVGPSSIPANIKAAPNADPFRPQIQQFVQAQLQGLAGEDGAAQKAAREKLIAECTAGSSQSYFDVYAQVLNDAVS